MALTFDAENRMTSYGGSVLTNGFRGDSLRAWKQNASGRTYFLYSGSQLVCEFNSSGTVTATNTVGPAGLISRHTSSVSVFYAFDTHGSVTQRLSSTGGVLSTQTFDAYGSRLSTDSNSDPYAGYGGQSGYYTDWETGTATSALALLTFRYYDPSAGRFLTRDPAGYKGGANRYEYISNGPTGQGDPLGLLSFPIGSAGGGCLGSAMINGTNNDPCNSSYDQCLRNEDCIAEAIAAVVAWGVISGVGIAIAASFPEAEIWFAANASRLEGCFEGLASGIGHYAAEIDCESKKCPSDAPDNPICDVIGVLSDITAGCIDRVFGGLLEKLDAGPIINEAIETLIESAVSSLNMQTEKDCQKGAYP